MSFHHAVVKLELMQEQIPPTSWKMTPITHISRYYLVSNSMVHHDGSSLGMLMKYRFLMPDIRELSDQIKPSKTNKGDGKRAFTTIGMDRF